MNQCVKYIAQVGLAIKKLSVFVNVSYLDANSEVYGVTTVVSVDVFCFKHIKSGQKNLT